MFSMNLKLSMFRVFLKTRRRLRVKRRRVPFGTRNQDNFKFMENIEIRETQQIYYEVK